MKVLFRDIDGVLNSTKTCVATGGYPMELHHRAGFDWMAIKLLQRLCDSSGLQIVLSSAWRLYHPVKEVAEAFELPIIDETPHSSPDGFERGYEIRDWLARHPEVTTYAIIDDNPDMLEEQMPYFVHTSGFEGMTWANFSQLCNILGESPMSGGVRNRHWKSETLAWE